MKAMSGKQSKEEEARLKAERAFRRAERLQQSEQRLLDEERRYQDFLAKTKRLRELRLAKEAAVNTPTKKGQPMKPA